MLGGVPGQGKRDWATGVESMTELGNSLRRMLGDNRGISSVEYALLLAVIGGGIVLAAGTLSTAISTEMTRSANCINGTNADCVQQ